MITQMWDVEKAERYVIERTIEQRARGGKAFSGIEKDKMANAFEAGYKDALSQFEGIIRWRIIKNARLLLRAVRGISEDDEI